MFGCVAFVYISKHYRDKFDPRALRCIFISYYPTQKGYKCYYPPTRKFFVYKGVTFVESQSFFGPILSGPQGESIDGDHDLPNLPMPTLDLSLNSQPVSEFDPSTLSILSVLESLN